MADPTISSLAHVYEQPIGIAYSQREARVANTGMRLINGVAVVYTHLNPDGDGTRNLGGGVSGLATDKWWATIFADTLYIKYILARTAGTISVLATLQGSGTANLGTNGSRWQDIYGNDIYTGRLRAPSGSTEITVYEDFKPSAGNSWDLGDATLNWKNFYAVFGGINDITTYAVTLASRALLATSVVYLAQLSSDIYLNAPSSNSIYLTIAGNSRFAVANGTVSVVNADLSLGSQYMSMVEMTAPASPSGNTVRIFARDDGTGKTQLMALFNTGAAQQVAIEP